MVFLIRIPNLKFVFVRKGVIMLGDIFLICWIVAMGGYLVFHDKIDSEILDMYCKYKAGVYRFWPF